MLTKDTVASYFSDNAQAWLADAYEQSGFNYPTPFHRLRVLKRVFGSLQGVNQVVDIGCGGGQVAMSLGELGYNVIGIDQSANMIANATDLLEKQNEVVRSNVRFRHESIYDLDLHGMDAVTAMGVIGYFPSDLSLFEIANKSLKKGGYFVVSFRNRLFDLCSISDYTRRDIESGAWARLIEEFRAASNENLSREQLMNFVQTLHRITGNILQNGLDETGPTDRPSKQKNVEYIGQCDPRQSTPDEVREISKQAGFKVVSFHGIHPHFANPHLNKLLPPTIFNQLSDSLIPLEDTKISLTWSSVFLGVFQKI